MNNTINLLLHEDLDQPKQSSSVRNLRRIAVGLLGGTFVTSFVLFLLVIFSPLGSLQQEKKQLTAKLLVSTDTTQKLINILHTNDRLESLVQLIAKRPAYESMLVTLEGQLPEGAIVSGVKLNNKSIIFEITSDSLGVLDTFVTNILQLHSVNTKLFRAISLTNLAYNQAQSRYTLALNLTSL